MDLLVLIGSLTVLEIASLAALAFVVVALVGLVIGLERYVFDGETEPVGLEDFERDEDIDGDAWR